MYGGDSVREFCRQCSVNVLVKGELHCGGSGRGTSLVVGGLVEEIVVIVGVVVEAVVVGGVVAGVVTVEGMVEVGVLVVVVMVTGLVGDVLVVFVVDLSGVGLGVDSISVTSLFLSVSVLE